MPYPPQINNRRNGITRALMNIQNPPPRQLPPQGGAQGMQPQQRPPTMASAGPPPPQMPGMAPAMTQGIAQAAAGPVPGAPPPVPLGQVPQQMAQNVRQAPQRVANLFSQQGAPPAVAAPLPPDPLKPEQPYG